MDRAQRGAAVGAVQCRGVSCVLCVCFGLLCVCALWACMKKSRKCRKDAKIHVCNCRECRNEEQQRRQPESNHRTCLFLTVYDFLYFNLRGFFYVFGEQRSICGGPPDFLTLKGAGFWPGLGATKLLRGA